MHPKRAKATTVDEYIGLFEPAIQQRLKELRHAIREAAPDAKEMISYSIPAYNFHGWLVYFSAYTAHLSISFPPQGIMQAFAAELKPYKSSKSTVQFPYEQPTPLDLVKKMIVFKVKENIALESAKTAAKKGSR
jgi:uncharacterized protein YdhG (YjbR/CyaY superfamily)